MVARLTLAVDVSQCRSQQGQRKDAPPTWGESEAGGSSPPPEPLSATAGLVPLGQLGQVVVVGRHLLVLFLLLGGLLQSGRVLGGRSVRAAGIGAGGRGRRRVIRRLVHEAPPHVDGVTGEEGPLEDVGPTERVAAEGAADLPPTERQEGRHHDEDDHVELDGAAREPDLLVHQPSGKRKSARMPASSSGRSPWMLWPAPSTPMTVAVGWRRSSSATSSSSTTDQARPRTRRMGIVNAEIASHQSPKSGWAGAPS